MSSSSGSIVTVKDDLIESVQFFVPRSPLFRWDTGPFVLYYAILFTIPLIQHMNGNAFSYSFESNTLTTENESERLLLLGSLILIPMGLLVHISVFLFSQTYPSFQVYIGNIVAPSTATLIDKLNIVALVKAAPNVGNDRIIKVDTSVRRTSRPGFMVVDLDIAATSAPSAFGSHSSEATLLLGRVEFQKVKYDLLLESKNKLSLQRVKYPTAAKVDSFLKWTGMGIQIVNSKEVDTVKAALNQWGLNEYDIPIPQFLDLYLTHLVAPFFVFQVLCLFLWSLDDYWIYSAFTLLMLLFFEGMMCRQRQNSLLMLRNMRRPPIPLLVFRYGQWVVLQSDMIVPGDIVSLTATSLTRRKRGQPEAAGDASQGQTVPCDALLLRGSCVVNEAMLTGESVPQMKEPPTLDASSTGQSAVADIGSDSNIAAEWKRHLVLSGTSLLIHNGSDGDDSNSSSFSAPPDRGCVCLVLRTGFGSTQGGLMRKILFARERVGLGGSASSSSNETAMFIALLVFFALVAAGWVLRQGLLDERRNVFRLVLHCVLVVTSVVPPELPMELSLAVTNSLAALAKVLVYCTEPFRIAMAGKLDVCCFDKTGTLTQDQMLLKGIVQGLTSDRMTLAEVDPSSIVEDSITATPEEPAVLVMEPTGFADVVLAAMGCCHDLHPPLNSAQSQTLLGDPLELATMGASGFHFDPTVNASASPGMCTVIHEERGLRLTVIHRFPFSSALKRMTVLAHRKQDDSLWVFCKGAPEVLREHMDPASVPANFQSTAFYHMSRGKRVLSIAFKKLSLEGLHIGDSLTALSQSVRAKYSRQDLETNLSFAGFLLFDCDLKADSKGVIRDLKAAQLGVVMITGDSVFTAAEVARKLGIVRGSGSGAAKGSKDKEKVSKTAPAAATTASVLILHCARKNEGEVLWRSAEVDGESLEQHAQDISFSTDSSAIRNLSIQYSLCVTGPALTALEKGLGQGYIQLLQTLAPKVSVFARVSPSQKESILLAMNDAGLGTLMCGDGTNDVGALKAAHVGVSIVNDPAFERRIEGNKKEKGGKGSTAKDRMARAMTELQEQEQDPTLVKLGDASIASPFTCRRTSVDCVLSVIRQGRCTLVTTIQVYKILALNCLVSAYMMSALYLRGLKQGDTQMTASGLVVAALFFLLSQAKPLQAIGHKRPASSVFAPSVALSIIGQVAVHLLSLLAALALCEHHQPSSQASSGTADGRFQPNLVNSAVFLLSAVMQVNNFVVNYRGDPFTQSLLENIPLLRTVQGLYGCLLLAVGGGLEPLNDLLQLAPFPNKDFQVQLLAILLLNSVAALAVEKLCQRLE